MIEDLLKQLIAALQANTAALSNTAAPAPAPAPAPTPVVGDKVTIAEVPPVPVEDLLAGANAAVKRGATRAAVKDVLAAHGGGAGSFKEVAPEHSAALFAALEALNG